MFYYSTTRAQLCSKQGAIIRLDLFGELPARGRLYMCYIHPSILVDVFLTSIDKLCTNGKKTNLDAIQQDTRHILTQI